MFESSEALADPDSSFPQACLWYHNSFEAVGKNLLKNCKICIFSSVALPQLLLISHEAEVSQFCRDAPDPLYILVLTSKEAEDLSPINCHIQQERTAIFSQWYHLQNI